jgi:SAM-dependent methyltransferase
VSGAFDPALAGAATGLELAEGRRLPLPVRRWHAAAAGADHWMLDRCAGATLDLGCGPGRLVAALHAADVPALGVDHSYRAMRLCRERGAPAVRGDLFARLPGEGGWRHVLLADGNIGIGGDPLLLLRRAASLVAPGGSVLVETAGDGLWRGSARLLAAGGDGGGRWFPWATVGLSALPGLARAAGLRVTGALHCGERGIAQLVREARRG